MVESSTARYYQCKDGDMLDSVAWRYYGATNEFLAAVVAANPHLINKTVLSIGDVVYLPDVEPTRGDEGFRLWG